MSETVVVLGASSNPARYSFLATTRLAEKGFDVIAIGNREGLISDIPVLTGQPSVEGVDTVTLYIGKKIQDNIRDYIISLHPKRIIFNPGTENPAFYPILESQGVKVLEACTLVMLSINSF